MGDTHLTFNKVCNCKPTEVAATLASEIILTEKRSVMLQYLIKIFFNVGTGVNISSTAWKTNHDGQHKGLCSEFSLLSFLNGVLTHFGGLLFSKHLVHSTTPNSYFLSSAEGCYLCRWRACTQMRWDLL